MADYYTQFSFELECISKEAADEIEKLLGLSSTEIVRNANDRAGYLNEHDKFTPLPEAYQDLGELDYLDFCSYARESETTFWLYSEEYGSIDSVATLISCYQKKWNDPSVVSFEWANSCSAPRLDSFGGGAVVLYKGKTLSTSTAEWVATTTKKIREETDN